MYNLMMNFEDTIDLDFAKYCLVVDETIIKDWIDPLGEWEKARFIDGERLPYSSIDAYVAMYKRWLKRAVKEQEKNGFIKTKYKYSANFQNRGRKFCEGFGIQKCVKQLRAGLIRDSTVDLDMSNAHPTLLLDFMIKNYPEKADSLMIVNLAKYIEHRDTLLNSIDKDRAKAKETVIICMNSNKKTSSNNKVLMRLDNAFKDIQNHLWTNYEGKDDIDKIYKASLNKKGTQNRQGKWLNYICSILENDCLSVAISCFDKKKIRTLMYDGFTIDQSVFTEETIQKLNEKTKHYGVKWTNKEHDQTAKVDQEKYIEAIEAEDNQDYATVKNEFEKNHFVVENPVMFCREYEFEGEMKYQFYSKEKFKDLVAPYQYLDECSSKIKPFLPEWIKDPERRSFKEVCFIPKLNDKSTEYYNSFRGWDYNPTEEPESTGFVDIFKEQINVLTNFHQESADYLIKYIAHSIQKPEVRPDCAMILKSDEGYGKDMLLETIALLTNRKYMMNTAEMKDIFGDFNIGIRDKIHIVLNETESKKGYENKEKIKGYITEERTIIREKNVSQYDQNNYVRLWILSNNFNPVQISASDRRFSVFKAHYKKPTREHFTEYRKHMKSKESLNDLMFYLLNVDISEFEPDRDRVITDAYKEMKTHNLNPLYVYLDDILFKNKFRETFPLQTQALQSKKDNTILIQSSELLCSYINYLDNENLHNIKIDFKLMKNILSGIGIKQEQKKINKKTLNWYIIDTKELKDILKTYIVEEEVEEIDLDDYE